jgi:competence protein ComEC
VETFSVFPFVRIIIPFITGILIYDFIPGINRFYVSGIFLFFLLINILFYFLRRERQLKWRLPAGISMVIFLFVTGIGTSILQDWRIYQDSWENHFNDNEEKYFFHVRIYNHPEEKEKSIRCLANVKKIKRGEKEFDCRGRIMIYFQKDSSRKISYGDEMVIYGTPQPIRGPANPGDMDYAAYMAHKRIFHSIYIPKDTYRYIKNSGYSLFRISQNLHDNLRKTIDSTKWSGNKKAIANALLIGDKSDMESELMNAFSATGTMHVLSVSGLHAGLIFLALKKLLDVLLKKKNLKPLRIILCLAGLWMYGMITGLSPSVVRSVTMLSFVLIGEWTSRSTGIYNSLAGAAFLMLCFDTQLIYDAGFQLSFIAVWGIVFFQKPFYCMTSFRNKWMDQGWKLTSVTLSAQLVTFPAGLYYFGSFPVWFLISNLVIIPVATICLYCGVLFLLFSFIPVLSDFLEITAGFSLLVMEISILFFSEFPLSQIFISLNFTECILVFLLVITIGIYFYSSQIKYISFALLLFLSGFIVRTHSVIENAEVNETIIYSDKENLVISVESEHTNLVLSFNGKISDRLRITIERDSRQKHKSSPVFIHADSTMLLREFDADQFYFHFPFFAIRNHTFKILSGKKDSPFLKVDYLIVCNDTKISQQKLKKQADVADKIIFADGNKWYRIKKWKEILDNKTIWDIGEQGAFCLQD